MLSEYGFVKSCHPWCQGDEGFRAFSGLSAISDRLEEHLVRALHIIASPPAF